MIYKVTAYLSQSRDHARIGFVRAPDILTAQAMLKNVDATFEERPKLSWMGSPDIDIVWLGGCYKEAFAMRN